MKNRYYINEAACKSYDGRLTYFIGRLDDSIVVVKKHITIWKQGVGGNYYLKKKLLYNYPEIIDAKTTWEEFCPELEFREINDNCVAEYPEFDGLYFFEIYDVLMPIEIREWYDRFTNAVNMFDELSVIIDELDLFPEEQRLNFLHRLFDPRVGIDRIDDFAKKIRREYEVAALFQGSISGFGSAEKNN